MQNRVTCKICNKSFVRIGNHIVKHGIDICQYKLQFPGAETCAYRHSEEALSKMRGPRPAFQGHKKSEETKQKLSAARLGRKFTPHSKETIEKMREAWKRRKADKDTYASYVDSVSQRMKSPEMQLQLRERFSRLAAENKTNGKSSDTSLERKFAAYLVEQKQDFDQQYILETRKGAFAFDFLVYPNTLVETDGEYWHEKSLEQINRDILKQRLCEEMGYIFVRISDRDWKPDAIFFEPEVLADHNDRIIQRRIKQFEKVQKREEEP